MIDIDNKILSGMDMVHSLPANLVKDDFSDFVSETSYTVPDLYIKKLGRSFVNSDSIAFNKLGVIPETLNWDIPPPRKSIQFTIHNLLDKLFNSNNCQVPHLLVTNAWSNNHYHWFCEVLPKILALGKLSNQFTLILPENNYIRSVGVLSIEKCGINFKDIVFIKPNKWRHVLDLWYIPPIGKSGQFHATIMKLLRSKLQISSLGGPKRIYISRQNSIRRQVLNEVELLSILNDYSFEIIKMEEFGFMEQLGLMSECKVLMGIHGAGLSSCIFMKDGGSIMELRKRENAPSNTLFWHLADTMKHAYFYLNGQGDHTGSIVGSPCNLVINPKDLDFELKNCLA